MSARARLMRDDPSAATRGMTTAIAAERLTKRVAVALGDLPADLVVRSVQLVNLYTDEIYPADILISDDRIAAVLSPGEGRGVEALDGRGLFAVPGLMDSHFHLESTLVLPAETAKMLVPRGVTTIFHDPHEVANVFGMRGLRLFRDLCAAVPMRLYLEIPSLVPEARIFETTGGIITFDDVREMLDWPEAASLGELDPMRLLPPLDEYVQRILAARERGLTINGHAAGLTGRHLQAFIAAGICDDHQCTSPDGAVERARLGMRVAARQGKRFNLPEILKAFHAGRLPPRNFAMCVDDKFANQIVEEGHMDFAVRMAIRNGLPPLDAIRGATLNTAEHFHLQADIGSIAPGRFADIALVSSLVEFKAEMVFVGGRRVAEGGALIAEPAPTELPGWSTDSVRLGRPAVAADFALAAPGPSARVHVIDMSRYHLRQIKVDAIETLAVTGGEVANDLERDILKVAVVERYTGSNRVGLGFLRGLGLKRGAMASSISHDHHNITVVGTTDADMAAAVNAVADMRGGLACVADGDVVAAVPLAFGGLMSTQPFRDVAAQLDAFTRASREVLGCTVAKPLGILPGLCLTSIPELGLTDLGLLKLNEANSYRPQFIDLVAGD